MRPMEIRVEVKELPPAAEVEEAPEAGPVLGEGGWLGDGLVLVTAGTEHLAEPPREETPEVDDDEPETTPIPKPEPLPDGVAGYVVALGRYGGPKPGGWLSCSDLLTREAAEQAAEVLHGTVCEVRVAGSE